MNRRSFLGALGSGAALPLVSALEGLARATAAPPVKRLITFYVSSGCAASYYWPTTASGMPFALSTSLAPLAPYQSRMSLIQGLSLGPGSNHRFGMDNCLTVGAQTSYEQTLATALKADLLNLSVAPLAGGNEMSFIN